MTTRRKFLQQLGLGTLSLPVFNELSMAHAGTGLIDLHVGHWGDRKVKVGLVGYGFSKFSADFGFQDHPNVEIVAVSDIIPERCEALSQHVKCAKKYASLEEMVKDNQIEAVFIATDAPNHARHAILALKHGKHVAVAVPAVFDKVEEAYELKEAVENSKKVYMMFETSCYREDLYAMKKLYDAGGFGKIVYSEGEYFHYKPVGIPSYLGWRDGMPPMYYLTHATAYHLAVTNGAYSEVSCFGRVSHLAYLKEGKNKYKNRFGTEVAIFKTADGAISRMMYTNDTQGPFAEEGRIRGELGSYSRAGKYQGHLKSLPDLRRPVLPAAVPAGGHGGSHGQLTHDFIGCILENKKPWLDVSLSLNLSVPGIIAHQSALKNGKTMKIPKF